MEECGMSDSDNDVILQMQDITKTFGPVTALSNVNLTVKRGEIHAICGENGAGKSTLMNVLSGVYPYGSYTGKIIFNGEECRFRNIHESEDKGIVTNHQELTLSPCLSIAENIFLGNERAKGGVVDWNQTRAQAVKLLDRVGLHENPDSKILDIGVGKQQLVEIAKALSKNVKLLILDEPTAALTDEDSAHLLNLMRDLRDNEGVTSVFITHKLNEVGVIADNVTIIRDGLTVGEMHVTPDKPLNQDELITKMVGRELSNLYPEHTSHIGDEIFRVKNWTVHASDTGRVIANKACFHVNAGEIVGFAGLIGAGRTEMMMSIFGRTFGSGATGEVEINGKAVNTHTVQNCINDGLAYATEDRKLYGLNLLRNIRENASVPSLGHLSKRGVVDVNQERIAVEKYRKEFNVKTPSIDDLVSNLSGGNQQKVLLAKWVISNPDILILDEPTRGIDVGAKYEIYEIIDQLADAGKAVVFVSSELPELIGICDRIYTVNQGVITNDIPKKDFSQEYLMKWMMEQEPSKNMDLEERVEA
jgi:putative multiple sugar transport system ATP-binding protein